jgi:hypothetical protein
MTKSLLDQLKDLQDENLLLKQDSAYGILTRPALEIEYRKLDEDAWLIFIDMDQIHALNEKYESYEPVDKMIRRAFQARAKDFILAGRWKSGDEIVFIVRTDPDGFIFRLQHSLKKFGLSATCNAQKIKGNDLVGAAQRAVRIVYAAKKADNRGGRV